MGNILRKISGVLTVVVLTTFVHLLAGAQGLGVSPIEFTDANGNKLTEYPAQQSIYVRASVENTQQADKTVYMIVCEYLESGVKVHSDYVEIASGESGDLLVEVPTVSLGNSLKATVIDRDSFFSSFVKPAVFLNNTLSVDYIKINGALLENYSDDINRYNVSVDTPYADIEVKCADSSQSYSVQSYALPAAIPVKVVSQLGDVRTIVLDIETTNPEVKDIIDENMIMWVSAENNEGKMECNTTASVWRDLSGYRNDFTVLDSWANNALQIVTKQEKEQLTAFPDKVLECVNSNSFTLKFTLQENGVSHISDSYLPIIGSDDGMLKLYIDKNGSDVYFQWGNAKFNTYKPKASLGDVQSGENAIVVDKDTETISWYIDGVLKSQKALRKVTVDGESVLPTTDRITLSYVDVGIGGSVGISDIKVYDKVLGVDELAAAEE